MKIIIDIDKGQVFAVYSDSLAANEGVDLVVRNVDDQSLRVRKISYMPEQEMEDVQQLARALDGEEI